MQFIEGNDFKILKLNNISEYDKLMGRKIIKGRSNQSERLTADFTGTNSFKEAENLRQFGDRDSYEKIKSVINKFDKKTHCNQYHHIIKNYQVGHSPLVPNMLAGRPDSMLFTEYKRVPNQQVTIIIETTFNRAFKLSEMVSYGATLLSLIDKLEQDNIRVELYLSSVYGSFAPVNEEKIIKKKKFYPLDKQSKILVHNFSALFDKNKSMKSLRYVEQVVKNIYHENTEKLDDSLRFVGGNIIKVKNFEDPLNTYKLAYYLVNPSYTRRHSLRTLEVTPNIFNDTDELYRYGVSNYKIFMKAERIYKSVFENCIYFNNNISPYFDDTKINDYVNDAFLRIKQEVLDIDQRKKRGRSID